MEWSVGSIGEVFDLGNKSNVKLCGKSGLVCFISLIVHGVETGSFGQKKHPCRMHHKVVSLFLPVYHPHSLFPRWQLRWTPLCLCLPFYHLLSKIFPDPSLFSIPFTSPSEEIGAVLGGYPSLHPFSSPEDWSSIEQFLVAGVQRYVLWKKPRSVGCYLVILIIIIYYFYHQNNLLCLVACFTSCKCEWSWD